jgi:hypothetical protein
MMTIESRSSAIVAAPVLVLARASCGEDHGLRTIRGMSLDKGRPATGANVSFE